MNGKSWTIFPNANIVLLILYCSLCCGCSCWVQKRVFDFDNDGLVDKTLSFSRSRLFKEGLDSNADGVMDTFVYYNKNNKIYMKEYDTDGDSRVDEREELFIDHRVKTSKDLNQDGLMDWCQILYCDENDEPLFIEIDWNMDDKVDSKLSLPHRLREDRVHGKWYQSFRKGNRRFIRVKGHIFPIVFSRGEWIIVR